MFPFSRRTDESTVAPQSAPSVVSHFKVVCINAGEDTPFPVTIESDAIAGDLKKAIKVEKRAFTEIDADSLNLHLVNLPDDDELTGSIQKFLKNSGPPLRATTELASLENIRTRGLVHILVRARQNCPPMCRLVPKPQAPATVQAKVQARIDNFLGDLRPRIKSFLERSPRLPYWTPPEGVNEETRKFYEKLRIPALRDKPNLLFDNIMNGKTSSSFDNLTNRSNPTANLLFTADKTVLCNASGSGKTSALLAGLCDHWGFYFTTVQDTDGIGSKDFQPLITRLFMQVGWTHDVFLGQSDSLKIQERSRQNERIVSREISKRLFARWTIFKLFIEVTRGLNEGLLPAGTKADWALFQSFPFVGEDVFAGFTNYCLAGVDKELLESLGTPSPQEILGSDLPFTPPIGPLFYYVLDEAQVAEEAHMRCFTDAAGKVKRSILHLIIENLTNANNYPVIISGNAFSLDSIRTVFASSGGNSIEWKIHYELDNLLERSRQEEYIRRYLPVEFLASETGVLFLDRMWKSCRGRHQFTARVLQEVLGSPWNLSGPASPLRILNAWIEAITGCNAIPYGPGVILREPPVRPLQVYPFKLDKFDEVPPLRSLLEDRLYLWLTKGQALTLDAKESKLVEYGLGRFIFTQEEEDNDDYIHIPVNDRQRLISIDEPLALISICRHFLRKRPFATQLAAHVNLNAGDDFKVVTMVALTQLLQNQIRLRDLIAFHIKPEWFRATAQIISQSSNGVPGQETRHQTTLPASLFDPQFSPLRANTPEEVIGWLRGESSAVWCEPGIMTGPDLMTRVELSSGHIVLILVKVKFRGHQAGSKNSLSAEDTVKLIESLTPSTWFSGISNDSFEMKSDMTEAAIFTKQAIIKQMLSEINKYKILGLIASHPPVRKLDGTNRGIKAALANHDGFLATLAFEEITQAYCEIEGGDAIIRRLKREHGE